MPTEYAVEGVVRRAIATRMWDKDAWVYHYTLAMPDGFRESCTVSGDLNSERQWDEVRWYAKTRWPKQLA